MDMDLSKLNPVGFTDHGNPDPEYHFDGIRQDLPEFQVETSEIAREIVGLFGQAVENGSPVAVAAGQAYSRNAILCVNPIGTTARNTAYGRANDDLLLQVTVRVDYRDAKGFLDGVEGRRLEAAKILAELEIAELERRRDEATARLEELKGRS